MDIRVASFGSRTYYICDHCGTMHWSRVATDLHARIWCAKCGAATVHTRADGSKGGPRAVK